MLLTLANNVVAVVANLCTRPPWQVAGVIQSWAFFCIALQFIERESDGRIMMKQTILCTNWTKQGSLSASVQTSRRSQANRNITGPVNGNGVKRNNKIIPNSCSSSIQVCFTLSLWRLRKHGHEHFHFDQVCDDVNCVWHVWQISAWIMFYF